MDNEEGEVKFVDAEQTSGKTFEKITFRQIVLQHLNKILALSCIEFVGGYTKEKLHSIEGMTFKEKVYVSDTREVYSNAVDSLSDILLPYFDKEMIQSENEYTKELMSLKVLDPQEFRNKKVQIKRKLFRALTCFLFRIQYLEGKDFQEEVE